MSLGSISRLRCLALAALCTIAAGIACSPRRPPEGPVVFEDEARVTPLPSQGPSAPAIERTRNGTISRARLQEVLDAGVGAFLAGLEVEAYFEGRTFWGWEIQRYDNPWVDLLPGDVIISINGKRIETPAQVQALWQSLAKSDEILVSAFRDPTPFELRFTVEGEASPTAP